MVLVRAHRCMQRIKAGMSSEKSTYRVSDGKIIDIACQQKKVSLCGVSLGVTVVEADAVAEGLRVRDTEPDVVRVREGDGLGVLEGDTVLVGVGVGVLERVGVLLSLLVARGQTTAH